MNFFFHIRRDIKANRKNPKGTLVCLLYRVAHSQVSSPFYLKPASFFIILLYKFITEYIIGTEIHWRSQWGPGLIVYHGYGTVVHSSVRAGANCVLRQGVTIGLKSSTDQMGPILGDGVEIGANAVIIGKISIGNFAKIGAGAVVTKDIPDRGIAVGNPARVVGYTI